MNKQNRISGKTLAMLNNLFVVGFIIMALAIVILCGWTLAIDPTWTSTVLVGSILGGLFAGAMSWWIVANYA